MRASCVLRVCVRVSCMKHVSLSVCVRMSECVWHMCAMFPHLFKRAYVECSFARLLCLGYASVYVMCHTHIYVCVSRV